MKTPHKHAEIIKAWADGQDIQVKLNSGWADISMYPSWHSSFEYRVKPEPRKYRVGLFSLYNEARPILISLDDNYSDVHFIKWLTEEFEVEE